MITKRSASGIPMIEAHAIADGLQNDGPLDGGLRRSGVSAEFGLHFWRGASGRRYLHVVYSLLACPELPASSVVLVRRNADQSMTVVLAGVVSRASGSANLAMIRQTAARLGANEVHVMTSESADQRRRLIAGDIATATGAAVLEAFVVGLSQVSARGAVDQPSLTIH